MQEAGLKPNEVTYASMINNAHIGAKDMGKAEQCLTWMQEASLKPDLMSSTSTINAHIWGQGCGKSGIMVRVDARSRPSFTKFSESMLPDFYNISLGRRTHYEVSHCLQQLVRALVLP